MNVRTLDHCSYIFTSITPLGRSQRSARGTQRQFWKISVRKTICDLEFSEHIVVKFLPLKVT